MSEFLQVTQRSTGVKKAIRKSQIVSMTQSGSAHADVRWISDGQGTASDFPAEESYDELILRL